MATSSKLLDIPVRGHMDDPGITWAHGKPNYEQVNKQYLKGRKMAHKAGSLEQVVENLVKTWEMESSHKIKAKDWKSVDPEKFKININGGRDFSLEDNIELGNYNMFMNDCPLYAADEETNESSHALFRSVFKSGFPWELLELFSGPPVVTFSWRHWGTWEGAYRDVSPTGETIEMYGTCVVRVSESLKIQSIEVYYDPNPAMAKLTGFKPGSRCPIAT